MVFLTLLIPAVAFGGEYEGLNPGVSTKADAKEVFGPPVREVKKGLKYDYNPKSSQVSRISINYRKKTGLIKTLEMYFRIKYKKSRLKELLELDRPVETRSDSVGNLVEFYMPQEVSLHFAGPDATHPVKYISHFDPEILEKGKGKGKGFGDKDPFTEEFERFFKPMKKEEEKSYGRRVYLGLLYKTHKDVSGIEIIDVAKNGPAHKAGLQSGDIILELEYHKFQKKGKDLIELKDLIAIMPEGKPLRFLIKRGSRKIEVRIALEEKAWVDQAGRGYKHLEDGQYDKAIRDFSKAIAQYPNTEYYWSRGQAYYKNGQYKEAISDFDKALELNPDMELAEKIRKEWAEAVKKMRQ